MCAVADIHHPLEHPVGRIEGGLREAATCVRALPGASGAVVVGVRDAQLRAAGVLGADIGELTVEVVGVGGGVAAPVAHRHHLTVEVVGRGGGHALRGLDGEGAADVVVGVVGDVSQRIGLREHAGECVIAALALRPRAVGDRHLPAQAVVGVLNGHAVLIVQGLGHPTKGVVGVALRRAVDHHAAAQTELLIRNQLSAPVVAVGGQQISCNPGADEAVLQLPEAVVVIVLTVLQGVGLNRDLSAEVIGRAGGRVLRVDQAGQDGAEGGGRAADGERVGGEVMARRLGGLQRGQGGRVQPRGVLPCLCDFTEGVIGVLRDLAQGVDGVRQPPVVVVDVQGLVRPTRAVGRAHRAAPAEGVVGVAGCDR
ncbi:hypothetical protein GALL_468590 [mine drainage metagenome]|uniref:Uncharacterized protein n=1 Tax=mine drainage metagenome TaxID=410659 RepID=A0A1J5Q218_9ZZZZ